MSPDKGLSLYFRFAYIEFADKESVRTAMALDESLFRGRQIKVNVFKHTSKIHYLLDMLGISNTNFSNHWPT